MFGFPYLKNADGQTHTLAVKAETWTNPDAASFLNYKKKNNFFFLSYAFMKLLLIIVINTVDVHLIPSTAHNQVAL